MTPNRTLLTAAIATLIALLPSAVTLLVAADISLSDAGPLVVAMLLSLGGYYLAIGAARLARPVPRVFLFLLPIAALLLLVVPAALKGSIEFDPRQIPHHLMCVSLTFGLAAVPSVATLIWMRRFVVATPFRAGVLSGLANGVVAATFSEALCQCGECGHIILLHGGGVAVVALAAAFLLRRMALIRHHRTEESA